MFATPRKSVWILLLALATVSGSFLWEPPAYGAPSPSRVKIRKRSMIKAPPAIRENQNEEYNAEKAAVLAQKRRSLIEDIKRYIRETRDNEQAAELNLRLGKLYMEDYYANMARAQQELDAKMSLWEKSKKGKAPELDEKGPRLSLNKARAVYKDLLNRAPNHPRRDEVLYFLAVSSMDEGKMEEAMRYLQRLVREIPRSKFYNDSLVQLGDYFFEKNSFAQAEGYYDKLIERKYLPLMPYAVYKKGWCAYNRQAFGDTIKQFKWVIGFADSDADSSALRIRGEAMRDIALPFTELKATDEAIAFFHEQGGQYFRQGLESMAGIYSEKGLHGEEIKVDEQLLALDPNHAKNPDYDLRIIDGLRSLNREEPAIQRLVAKLPLYAAKSTWYELNSGTPAVVQGAYKAFEEVTRNFGTQVHAVAQKTKNEGLYNRAKGLYEQYVEYFPQTDHTSQVRFSLAEIQFRQHAFVAAAENYYKVYEDPRAGKLRAPGIRYALSALDQQLNIDRKKAGLTAINSKTTSKLTEKDDVSLEPVPYSATESRFFVFADEYLKQYPSAKDAADVLYEQAYLRYTHHDLADAFRAFWVLVQKYPSHETAVSSAYLILDILNRRKEYPKLIAACQKFLDTKELSRASFRQEVADILRKAELKRIAELEEKGLFKDAGDNYIEYTKAYGAQDEGLFEKALYNAAVNYTKAGALMPAVESQEKFLRRFPKSKFRESMVLQVAKTYETLANFEKSGQYFEEFSNAYPNNAQSKNALRLAGVYLAGSGHSDRAENIFARFTRMYPAEFKTVERDLLMLYESQNATEKMFRYYLQARATRGITYSDYLSYTMAAAEIAAARSGKLPVTLMEEGHRAADKFGGEIRKSPKGVEALAKVRFWWVSQREALFHRYKLTLPQETMAANLKRKLLLLQELEREYGKIASLGSAEWGLGAIFKTAAIYRHMAESVQTAPVPPELDAEALEQYRGELKRQMIQPFNEKAKSFAANCLDKAQEYNVLSPWTAQCYGMASELDPERYPRARTFYLPPMMLSLQLPPKESKTEVGGLKRFAYPFYSSAFFTGNRQLASMAPIDLPLIYDSARKGDAQDIQPNPTSYEALTTERRNVLKHGYDSEKPDDIRKGASFSFMNMMRLVSAQKAIPLIEVAIQRDPENTALVNLLGLAFLEAGKTESANVCWMSLIARSQATASVWNNLGVAAARAGNEAQAISYFQEAVKLPNPKEALVNLGFLALKYRNGFEAKNMFKKASQLDDDDVPAQIGMAVASLQNRQMDDAKEMLIDLSRRYSKDPYLKLSLGYFLIDVEHEMQAAQKVITDYMESQSMEKDITFRQLLLEARQRPEGAGVEQVDAD